MHLTGVVRSSGTFSGGTLRSTLIQFSRARRMRVTSRERRAAEPRPEDRKVRGRAERPHRDSRFGYWLVPLPTLDPFIVVRSAAALPSFGPDFTYSHYAGVRRLRTVVAGIVVVGGLMVAAQIGPLRRLMLSRIQRGHGTLGGATGEVGVHRALPRRGRRPGGADPGVRR